MNRRRLLKAIAAAPFARLAPVLAPVQRVYVMGAAGLHLPAGTFRVVGRTFTRVG